MAFNRIILWLGNTLILISILMAVTALFGTIANEAKAAAQFGAMALATGLFGLMFVFATWKIPTRENMTDALGFLLLFWIFVPIITAIPYVIVADIDHPVTAYFESVSAFTTTGATSLKAEFLPQSMHIWRSLLQWCGGVFSATFAVVILAALNLRGTGVHRSLLFTFNQGELFAHLGGVARVIAMLYGLIAFLCFLGLIVSGTPVFEATCLALSAMGTGGLTPRDDLLHNYVGFIGVIALCLTCIFGAFNVAIIWDGFRLRSVQSIKVLLRHLEHKALFFVIGFLFVIGVLYTQAHHPVTVLIEAIFFASSAGFDYHVIGLEVVPPIILIALALVGGAALSTAGGVKLIRIILLFRHLGTDISRLSHPSRVVPVIFRGQILPDEAFLSIWIYFLGYTLVFAAGIVLLAIYGMDFETAVATSAAALSNMGPLLNYTMAEYGFESMNHPQHIIASVLMLVGRVEVLAAIGVLTPGLWRS